MSRTWPLAAFAAALLLVSIVPRATHAQETTPLYQEGDRVEVDVNMSSSPEYQTWRTATVLKVEMWQGQVAAYHLKTDDGHEVTTASRFMRASSAPAPVASQGGGGTGGNAGAPAGNGGGGGGARADSRSAGTGNCRVGLRVTDRENRSGVVMRADGPSCWVRLDSGEEHYYLQWMLTPGGAAAGGAGNDAGNRNANAAGGETTGPLASGSYTCWAANGNAGVLRLIIKSGGQYSNEQGTTGRYAYDSGNGQITFQSGPWAGYYGQKLGPAKIGLSSRPGGFSSTVCDLK